MSDKEKPNRAPKPKRPPKGMAQANPGGKRARFMKLLAANWKSSDQIFWRFQPNHRFRFGTEELKQMAELVPPDQFEAALSICEDGLGKLKAANAANLPYPSVWHDRTQRAWVQQRPSILADVNTPRRAVRVISLWMWIVSRLTGQ